MDPEIREFLPWVAVVVGLPTGLGLGIWILSRRVRPVRPVRYPGKDYYWIDPTETSTERWARLAAVMPEARDHLAKHLGRLPGQPPLTSEEIASLQAEFQASRTAARLRDSKSDVR
jgi:hypothetical protein